MVNYYYLKVSYIQFKLSFQENSVLDYCRNKEQNILLKTVLCCILSCVFKSDAIKENQHKWESQNVKETKQ